ncbi:MAG: hypothetical protein HY050_08730 [Actinobacteria bacterium]|nr:hypothetical protein [Actinomycetota bacterium]
MNVCEKFRELSTKVWHDLGKARSLRRQLKEESITDYIMQEVMSLPASQIITKEFTRHEEHKEGADWEWHFRGRDATWFRMRLQAKIIDLDADRYPHLHYKRNGVYQSDTLIARAKAVGALPAYCLYTHSNCLDMRRTWRCTDYRSDVKKYGCSLVLAHEVLSLRANNTDTLSGMLQLMRPWHCSVCCRVDENAPLSHRVRRYWELATTAKRVSRPGAEEIIEYIPSLDMEAYIPQLSKNAPDYVIAMLEGSGIPKTPDDQELRYVSVFTED